jgi:hypothetical protein
LLVASCLKAYGEKIVGRGTQMKIRPTIRSLSNGNILAPQDELTSSDLNGYDRIQSQPEQVNGRAC